jgi:hypothetical protein
MTPELENNQQSNNHMCSSWPNNDQSHWVHQDQTNNDQKIINQLITCVHQGQTMNDQWMTITLASSRPNKDHLIVI